MIVLLTSPGGHPPGTEAMFYTTRKSVQRHAGWADHVLLVIDFSNAFDTDDGLRSSLKCCSACRACLLGQSGDLFPESPLSSKVGRAATGPAGRFLFALVPPLQTCSLPSWWLTWMVCAWPTNKPTMLLMRKPWWFFGGSSQRSTPIGQQFSLNTQKVNQQLTKVSYPNLCYYAGSIFGIYLIKEQIIFILVSRIVFTVKIQPRCWVVCLLLLSKFWWTGKKNFSYWTENRKKIAAKTSATGSQNNPACVTTFVAERDREVARSSGCERDLQAAAWLHVWVAHYSLALVSG